MSKIIEKYSPKKKKVRELVNETRLNSVRPDQWETADYDIQDLVDEYEKSLIPFSLLDISDLDENVGRAAIDVKVDIKGRIPNVRKNTASFASHHL